MSVTPDRPESDDTSLFGRARVVREPDASGRCGTVRGVEQSRPLPTRTEASPDGGGAVPTTARAASSERIPVTDQVTLHTLVRPGAGDRRVLLVHGLASNARLWDGVGEILSGHGIGSIAVDLRGHGRSDRSPDGYEFKTIADDLASILSAVGDTGSWVVAGQSWGGNVVLEFAARHPAAVDGVVLVDGGFIRLADSFDDEEAAVDQLRPPDLVGITGDRLAAAAAERFDGFPVEGVEAQMANFEEMPDGRLRPRLRLEDHLEIVRHLYRHDPDALAARLEMPVAVIAVGEPGSRPRVDAFARQLRLGRVEWVAGHHDIHAQRPDLVASIIESLVR